MKTYICNFTYKQGNGYALIAATKISDCQNILISQGMWEGAHISNIKESQINISACGPSIIIGGVISTAGQSAYDLAVSLGFTGTIQEWLESLKGNPGPQGEPGPQGPKGIDGTVSFQELTPEQKEQLRGPQGEQGPQGEKGDKGDTGETGPQGPQGAQGLQGMQGEKGDTGAKGESGFSPIATVNKSNDTTTVTITDKNGTTTATIKDGTNGKTSYLHIKYSDDGSTFTSNNGETPGNYIGQYVDFTQEDSMVFSKYTWALIKGTESDPIFSASVAANITESNISAWNNKQDSLVSGTNIKTINNQSLLGGGNISISGGDTNIIEMVKVNGTTLTPDSNKAVDVSVPTETTVSGWGFTKNTGTYSKPSGGIPATDLAQAVQTSLGKADTALQSFTETDPTVPSWAKQTNKPTYTASEVGAVPTSRTINGKALTSDITLTANDVAALPNTTVIPAAQVNSDWNAVSGVAQILNKPTIPTIPTNVSAFTNDAGYLILNDIRNKQNKQTVNIVSDSSLSTLTLEVDNDYYVSNATINTCEFALPSNPNNGIISIMFTTGTVPNVTFSSTSPIFIQEGFNVEPSSYYEMSIRAFNGKWHVVLVKMEAYTQ